ncbi:hypothetical protein Tco_0576137 [Tanacetum coccineum]
MTTLTDKAILSSADNRPPMLAKDMYDSWKRRMELYMMNRQHGRMILESVENSPLIWPTIEKNGVTRPTKYSELSATEANQVDCDIKATNIILQGLPPEVFALVSNHKVAKELWERIQLLMQGTSLTKQERCQTESGLIVPVFQKGDDPIDAINHMTSFLTAVVTSRYPTTNNQLRNSSNPRQQAIINDGRITLQLVQGRQISLALGTSRTYTPGASRSNFEKQKTVICYNYKGEGHMSKQCTKPKRKQDDSWFKDKALLVQAQASGQILHDEELAFLADPRVVEAQATQTVITHNAVNHSGTEITSDSNIIPYSQYVIKSQQAAVQNSNSSAQQDALILSVIEQLKPKLYKEQVKVLKEGQNVDLRSNDNSSDTSAQSVKIDRLKQTLSENLKVKESLMQTVTLLKNDFKKEESRNIDREIALEKRIKQLDNIKAQQLEPKLYDGNVIKNTSAIVILDSEETLILAEESRSKMLLKQKDPMMLEKKVNTTPVDYANYVNSPEPTLSSRPTIVEVPKELPKISMVNKSLKKLKHHLAGFDVVVKERTTPTTITEGSWGPKCLSSNETGCGTTSFRVKNMNQVLNENERLLEQVINKDVVNIIVNSSVDDSYVNAHECEKCLKLETELLNKKDFVEKEIYDKLFKSFTTLEKTLASF